LKAEAEILGRANKGLRGKVSEQGQAAANSAVALGELNAKVEQANARVEQQRLKMQSGAAQLARLRRSEIESKANVTRLEQQQTESQNRLAELDTNLAQRDSTILANDVKEQALRSELQQVSVDAAESQKAFDKASMEMQAKHVELEAQLATSETSAKELSQQSAALIKEKEGLTGVAAQQLDQQIRKAGKELTVAQAESDALRAGLKESEGKLAKALSEAAYLRNELGDVKREKDHWADQVQAITKLADYLEQPILERNAVLYQLFNPKETDTRTIEQQVKDAAEEVKRYTKKANLMGGILQKLGVPPWFEEAKRKKEIVKAGADLLAPRWAPLRF